MEKYGFLVTYGNCSGCLKCEKACRETHEFKTDENAGEKSGIKIAVLGPFERGGETQTQYHMIPTAFCDHCNSRIMVGKPPSCVESCPERCIEFGKISELGKKLTDRKMALITL